MWHEFSGIVEAAAGDETFVARCLERPGAQAHGRTPDEALRNLAHDLALTLRRRTEAPSGHAGGARRTRVH